MTAGATHMLGRLLNIVTRERCVSVSVSSAEMPRLSCVSAPSLCSCLSSRPVDTLQY